MWQSFFNSICLTCSLLVQLSLAPSVSFSAEKKEEKAEPIFENDIQGLLTKHCTECHGEKQRKADLSLSNLRGLISGGESGPAIVPGKANESLLIEYLRDGLMPPEDRPSLSKEEIALIEHWVESGANATTSVSETRQQINQHDVTPIMLRRCIVCHGSVLQEGGTDLRNRVAMLLGGESGAAIVLGKPDESLVVQRVREQLCPPEKDLGEAGIEPMSTAELTVIENWISDGAPVTSGDNNQNEFDLLVTDEDRQWWAFLPPQDPAIPNVKNSDRIKNSIDAFLLQKLEENELTFSEEADRLTIMRRLVFDLTGLPPQPDDVNEFLADKRPDAYERLVDRLLNSERYGEHWARFWLDLAGYADSEGKRSADLVRPYAWRYRDYVIRSFNNDKPFNQFLVEQIAGDELVDYANEDASLDVIEKLVATGFLRMAPDGTSADPVNRISDRIEVISDEVDVLSRGVMGLTMKCARCHSHKYDPIPQRDYYRFTALFKGAYDEYEWLTPQPFGNQWNKANRRFLTVVSHEERSEIESHNVPINENIKNLQVELKEELDAAQKKKLQKEIKNLQGTLREIPKIRALWDRGQPSQTYIYRRGDEFQPAQIVAPGIPAALNFNQTPLEIVPPSHSSPKTGRRLALARWLTQPENPLTARVYVNRIWQQYFGTGIVKSLDNFGRLGTLPTHPELLDWLAVQFVEEGWSTKQLHRTIVTSSAYRQASSFNPEHAAKDPSNELLTRMPMRRLSAEELRDTLLMVSASLELRMFGTPDQVEVRNDGLVTGKASENKWRRSIYLRQRRKELPSLLETFDLPQMNPNCSERKNSTIVSQPLYLLNNGMVHELAGHFAGRLKREGSNSDEQLKIAWLWAFGRPITKNELIDSRTALAKLESDWMGQIADDDQTSSFEHALADICHALFNSAEFLYID